jgi:hypothetical protein
MSVSRELTSRDRAQKILLSSSLPIICAIGAVADMWTLVELVCFFPQSIALALALSFALQGGDAGVEGEVTLQGNG